MMYICVQWKCQDNAFALEMISEMIFITENTGSSQNKFKGDYFNLYTEQLSLNNVPCKGQVIMMSYLR